LAEVLVLEVRASKELARGAADELETGGADAGTVFDDLKPEESPEREESRIEPTIADRRETPGGGCEGPGGGGAVFTVFVAAGALEATGGGAVSGAGTRAALPELFATTPGAASMLECEG